MHRHLVVTLLLVACLTGQRAAVGQTPVGSNPGSSESRRASEALIHAQQLYWSGNYAGADSAFTSAMASFPSYFQLRLEYGRMLTQLVRPGPARAVLTPLLENPEAQAPALTLLGTLAYWDGDYTTARTLFRRALARDPRQRDAQRQLDEIRMATAPWVRGRVDYHADTQPVRTTELQLESGWYATPLHALALMVRPDRFSAGSGTPSAGEARAAYRGYWPQAHLETEAAAGLLRRSFANGDDWTARIGGGIRFPQHVAIRASWERAPYYLTAASLVQPVLTETAQGLLAWSPGRGWAGEGEASLQRFPDNNSIRTVSGWLLAPVIRSRSVDVAAGYAFSSQDARSSRWIATPGAVATPATGYLLPGRYAPYYTPAAVVAHSVAGSLALHPAGQVQMRFSGSYGFAAHEQAPYLYLAGTGAQARVTRGFYPRVFHPGEAHASLTAALSPRLSADLGAGYARTAYWNSRSFEVGAFYRWMRLPP